MGYACRCLYPRASPGADTVDSGAESPDESAKSHKRQSYCYLRPMRFKKKIHLSKLFVKNRTVYEKCGTHPAVMNEKAGYAFSVWAPHACRISVVGNFNHLKVAVMKTT